MGSGTRSPEANHVYAVLYVIYYIAVLRNQFYPFLAQSDPKLLIFGLLPFLLFMVAEVMEILLVPTHLTKRLASFTGLNFEIAYILRWNEE